MLSALGSHLTAGTPEGVEGGRAKRDEPWERSGFVTPAAQAQRIPCDPSFRGSRTRTNPGERLFRGAGGVDAAAVEDRTFGELEVDQGGAVSHDGFELVDLALHEVALGLGDEEARRGADAEAFLLGAEGFLAEGAGRGGGGDLLAGALDLGGGEADVERDELVEVSHGGGGLLAAGAGAEVAGLGGAVAEEVAEARAGGDVVGLGVGEVAGGVGEGIGEAGLAEGDEEVQAREQAVAGDDGFEAVLLEAEAGLVEVGAVAAGDGDAVGEVVDDGGGGLGLCVKSLRSLLLLTLCRRRGVAETVSAKLCSFGVRWKSACSSYAAAG